MTTPVPALLPIPGAPKDAAEARALAEEIRVGLDRMRHMSHDELRDLVQSRIRMLDSVMTEREQKKAAIETARLAAGVLEIRRERAHSIRRRVDAWSAAAAVACFGYVMMHIGL
jgi:hypothetical protein